MENMKIKSISSDAYFDEVGAMYFDVKTKYDDGTKDGFVEEKRISAEDYLDMFTSSVKKGNDFREVVRLPKEVAWAAQGEERDTFKAVVTLPAKVRPVFYAREILQVPFPPLAAYVSVEGGVRKGTKFYAADGEGPDAGLYVYPFGNVYGSGGDCCFGNIVVSNVASAAEATKVTDAFLDGETNGDLWGATVAMQEKGIKTQGDLYEFLKGLKEFPMELLAPMHKNVKSLCRA